MKVPIPQQCASPTILDQQWVAPEYQIQLLLQKAANS